jgi:hypothetical protein
MDTSALMRGTWFASHSNRYCLYCHQPAYSQQWQLQLGSHKLLISCSSASLVWAAMFYDHSLYSQLWAGHHSAFRRSMTRCFWPHCSCYDKAILLGLFMLHQFHRWTVLPSLAESTCSPCAFCISSATATSQASFMGFYP